MKCTIYLSDGSCEHVTVDVSDDPYEACNLIANEITGCDAVDITVGVWE